MPPEGVVSFSLYELLKILCKNRGGNNYVSPRTLPEAHHPTMRLGWTSRMKARYRKPSSVWTYVMAAAHTLSLCAAAKFLFTRSSAGLALLAWHVIPFLLPRLHLCSPAYVTKRAMRAARIGLL
jgi:hypothetical protein